jgi:hypothetical protein
VPVLQAPKLKWFEKAQGETLELGLEHHDT